MRRYRAQPDARSRECGGAPKRKPAQLQTRRFDAIARRSMVSHELHDWSDQRLRTCTAARRAYVARVRQRKLIRANRITNRSNSSTTSSVESKGAMESRPPNASRPRCRPPDRSARRWADLHGNTRRAWPESGRWNSRPVQNEQAVRAHHFLSAAAIRMGGNTSTSASTPWLRARPCRSSS